MTYSRNAPMERPGRTATYPLMMASQMQTDREGVMYGVRREGAMAKSIDEIIAATVSRAVTAAINDRLKPVEKRLAEMQAALANVLATEGSAAPEKLLPMCEARARLGVNQNKLRELIDSGALRTGQTPGGKVKVLETSLNAYITDLVGGTA